MYRRNEELDDKAVIRRLKCRVAELETELALMRKQYPTEQKVYSYLVMYHYIVVHSICMFSLKGPPQF